MPFFTHDGIRFYYEIIGQGPAVVFTHGLGGDLSQSKDLLGQVKGHQILLWDVRAHGATEPVGPEEKLNFTTFAQDLSALLDHVGIDRAVFGGISMGAGISAAFAVHWPERVRALALVRPAWEDQGSPPNLRHLLQVRLLLDAGGPGIDLQKYRALPEYEPFRSLPEDLAEGVEAQLTKPQAYERRGRLERVTQASPISSWQEVKTLTMPTLVFGNEPDTPHPIGMAKQWARRVPKGRLVIIPSKANMDAHRREFQKAFYPFLEEEGNRS